MNILKKTQLQLGGFAGLTEHRLIKDPKAFGPVANADGSWPGLGNFVYLADARFNPGGETRMHKHHEIDVISVMVEGNIAHQGSMGHGKDLHKNDVQVQRAGGEGFAHNEVNPDSSRNRMLQLWVLPEVPGEPAGYKVYQPKTGELTRIYGGNGDFPAKTHIHVGLFETGQEVNVEGKALVYISRGSGSANGQTVEDGDLLQVNNLNFAASEDVQLVVVQAD